MATQAKKEKLMLRQAVPAAPVLPEEAAPSPMPAAEPAPQPDESIAQYQDTLGDRIVYAIWLVCAALLILHVLCDTIFGRLL